MNKDKLITGTADGNIYEWEGRDLKRAVKCTDAEKACAIMDVVAVQNHATIKLISGAKDGKICLFDGDLAILKTLNINNVVCDNLRVRNVVSVDLSGDGKKILVGTAGSEILEIETEEGTMVGNDLLMSCHCKDELWGLGVHNEDEDLFATSGDDGVCRVYSIGKKKMLCLAEVGDESRACSFNGNLVCAGIGAESGRKKKRKNPKEKAGGYAIMKFDKEKGTLSKSNEERCAKEWVGDLKFSPSGKKLAVSSHDNKIYLYDVNLDNGTTEKKGICAKHNSYITHVDFTADETALMSTCGAYELLWFSTKGFQIGSNTQMQQITSATSMRDQNYAPFTCTLGWPVQGIFPEGADGTEVNGLCIDEKKKYVVTSNDSGLVRLFNFPCLKGAEGLEGVGHSSHVTCVR